MESLGGRRRAEVLPRRLLAARADFYVRPARHGRPPPRRLLAPPAPAARARRQPPRPVALRNLAAERLLQSSDRLAMRRPRRLHLCHRLRLPAAHTRRLRADGPQLPRQARLQAAVHDRLPLSALARLRAPVEHRPGGVRQLATPEVDGAVLGGGDGGGARQQHLVRDESNLLLGHQLKHRHRALPGGGGVCHPTDDGRLVARGLSDRRRLLPGRHLSRGRVLQRQAGVHPRRPLRPRRRGQSARFALLAGPPQLVADRHGAVPLQRLGRGALHGRAGRAPTGGLLGAVARVQWLGVVPLRRHPRADALRRFHRLRVHLRLALPAPHARALHAH
mmetsp:Transcript_11819/g.39471  ORF Transcript_11819/g.39471 Transcript_11819/m.39471 type:complete len:334 (-) Transcript_11819:362-1363(-)